MLMPTVTCLKIVPSLTLLQITVELILLVDVLLHVITLTYSCVCPVLDINLIESFYYVCT